MLDFWEDYKTVSFIWPKIWDTLPDDYKHTISLNSFKGDIKNDVIGEEGWGGYSELVTKCDKEAGECPIHQNHFASSYWSGEMVDFICVYREEPLSDCNRIRTHNHLVRKRAPNNLVNLAK